MSTNRIKLALHQFHCAADPASNLDRVEAAVNTAADQGARLLVLQELHNTLYFCQDEDAAFFDLAEPVPGPTSDRLAQLAKQHDIVIVASLFEKRSAGLYHNTAVVLDRDGSIAGRYRKMHIPDDPGYYEKYYFTPGDLGFTPIRTSIGTLGVLVCWDQWYPEAARLMTMAGADMLIYPTAIGWEPSDPDEEKQRQFDAWQTIQRSHAIANGIPVISCNRQGTEVSKQSDNRIDFWGGSFVCDSFGHVIASAGHDQDEVLVAEIDLQQTELTRRVWPFLRDRRIDSYTDLVNRFID